MSEQSTMRSAEGQAPGAGQLSVAPAQRWWILAVLCLVVTVVEVDATVVNVALPSISRALGATTSDLAWVNDAYILTLAAFMLVGGRLGDQFGHKLVLVLSLLLLGASSALCAFSTSTLQLIVGRGLLGIGAAGMLPATLALITLTFSAKERPRAFGIWAAATIIGLPLGPLLGGFLLDHFWWGSVFLINVPLVAITVVSIALMVPRIPATAGTTRQDVPGVALSGIGLGALLFAVIEGPRLGWFSAAVVGTAVVAVVLLTGFVLWERRAAAPVLDLRLLRIHSFVTGSLATVLSYFAFTGILFILTLYLQSVLGLSPLSAGAGLIPLALPFTLASVAAAKLATSIGTRTVVALGLALIGVGMLVLVRATATSGYVVVGTSLALSGLGAGLTTGQALAAALSEVPPALAGAASAVRNSVRQTGGALGVAVMGSVLASAYGAALAPALSGVAGSAAQQARESIVGADAAAASLGGAAGAALLRSAHDAFVSGLHTAAIVGAVLTFLSAIAVFVSLPAGNLVVGGEGEGEGEAVC